MYNAGTISTTSGSNIIAGTGTTWLASISSGDVLVLPVGASGKLYRVFSVDSDTQITLWGNVSYTVSDSPYELGTDFTTSTILSSEDIAVANVYATSGLANLAKTGEVSDIVDLYKAFNLEVRSSSFTAESGNSYILYGDISVTLPPDATNGEKIILFKGDGDATITGQIKYEEVIGTEILFDLDLVLSLVYNQGRWNIQIN